MSIRHVLTLNPRHATAKDIGELHRLVMAGYPSDLSETSPRQELNILFLPRAETLDTARFPNRVRGVKKILVQADIAGDWKETSYYRDRVLGLEVSDPINVTRDYTTGDRIEINALANATHSIPSRPAAPGERRQRGRAVPIPTAEGVIDWTVRVFAQRGLDVDRTTVAVGKPLRHMGYKNDHQIVIDGRPITAQGTVADPNLLTHALITGIGKGRAYGAGLIRHRRIS